MLKPFQRWERGMIASEAKNFEWNDISGDSEVESGGSKGFTSHNGLTHPICLLNNGCFKDTSWRKSKYPILRMPIRTVTRECLSLSLLFFSLGRDMQEVIRKPEGDTNYNEAKYPSGLLPMFDILEIYAPCLEIIKQFSMFFCLSSETYFRSRAMLATHLFWLMFPSDFIPDMIWGQLCVLFWYLPKRKLFWKYSPW